MVIQRIGPLEGKNRRAGVLVSRLVEAWSRPKTLAQPVQRRLLVPLTGVLLLLVSGFGMLLFKVQYDNMYQSSKRILAVASDELERGLSQHSQTLAALEEVILRDSNLRGALKAQDRDRLIGAWGDLFASLRDEHFITHFYFHGPDRVNLLRVHKPETYGDLIERFTAREAERTGKAASGIELGPLGTFTLRVVRPVFDGDTLVGYLELGKEIEDILAAIHNEHEVELAVAIHKSVLKREKWEAGMAMLGREDNWDLFHDQVLIYSSLPRLPLSWATLLHEEDHQHKNISSQIDSDGGLWDSVVVPLSDASGVEVGDLIISRDTSKAVAWFNGVLVVASGAVLVILAVLLGFLYAVLRRTDQGIRKQHEEVQKSRDLFESIVSNNPGVTYRRKRDKDGTVLYVSAQVFHICGYPASDFINNTVRPYESVIHPEDGGFVRASVDEGIESGKPWEIEYRVCHQDGGIRWVYERGRGVAGKDGRVEFIDGFVIDITRRRKAEEDRAELEEHLRQAQKMESIGTLAGGFAHEFNNILGTIMGYTEMALLVSHENTGVQSDLEQVLHGGTRAKDLINQVLDFSRRGNEERKAVDILPIVEETLNLIESSLPPNMELRKNIQLASGVIMAVGAQIEEIVANLCRNACQAMQESGGVLEVSLRERDLGPDKADVNPNLRSGSYVQLTVSDTGCGIEEAVLDRVFDPFFTTRAPGEGTGMGLAVVHGILKTHGGAISVSSEPGQGTTFSVMLPRLEQEAASAVDHAAPPLAAARSACS